jgi:hypothetical protein
MSGQNEEIIKIFFGFILDTGLRRSQSTWDIPVSL